MARYIAVIDDEPDILELISLNLKKAGFNPKTFSSAKTFFNSLSNNLPQLIILDLMLPDLDGYEVCKRLRADKRTNHLPIIMLTARGEELDKVLGLELGADDYMTKPFSPKELAARVKALLRRTEPRSAKQQKIFVRDKLQIDPEKYEVSISGEKIEMTTTEFKILLMLVQQEGMVFSREKILENLWGNEKAVFDRTVDVHVRHLREKLGAYGGQIKNIRGIGYKWVSK